MTLYEFVTRGRIRAGDEADAKMWIVDQLRRMAGHELAGKDFMGAFEGPVEGPIVVRVTEIEEE